MGQDPKKQEAEGNWDFKIEAPESNVESAKSKASERLKQQARERKEANPSLKIEKSKALGLSRTKLAAMEAERGKLTLAPVPTEVRLKAAAIDLVSCFGLWALANSVKNPLALAVIAEAKARNMAYLIEQFPMFPEAMRALCFLGLYSFFVFLPAILARRTLGKAIMGCVVEHEGGGYPSKGALVLRESVGKLLSLVTVVGVAMGLGKTGKFLHDKMAKTLVIKARP